MGVVSSACRIRAFAPQVEAMAEVCAVQLHEVCAVGVYVQDFVNATTLFAELRGQPICQSLWIQPLHLACLSQRTFGRDGHLASFGWQSLVCENAIPAQHLKPQAKHFRMGLDPLE